MSLVCGKVGRDDMDFYLLVRLSFGIVDIFFFFFIFSDIIIIVAIFCVCILLCMS